MTNLLCVSGDPARRAILSKELGALSPITMDECQILEAASLPPCNIVVYDACTAFGAVTLPILRDAAPHAHIISLNDRTHDPIGSLLTLMEFEAEESGSPRLFDESASLEEPGRSILSRVLSAVQAA